MLNKPRALLFWLVLSAAARAAEPLPVFDAHLHYNEEATARYPVARRGLLVEIGRAHV